MIPRRGETLERGTAQPWVGFKVTLHLQFDDAQTSRTATRFTL